MFTFSDLFVLTMPLMFTLTEQDIKWPFNQVLSLFKQFFYFSHLPFLTHQPLHSYQWSNRRRLTHASSETSMSHSNVTKKKHYPPQHTWPHRCPWLAQCQCVWWVRESMPSLLPREHTSFASFAPGYRWQWNHQNLNLQSIDES